MDTELNHQESFYKSLLDNLYDGVYFVDTDRRITYWNKGAERITGYMSDQVLRQCCADNMLNHVNESGMALCENGCPLSASMEDGLPREAHVFLHHADGHRVPVLVRVAPLRNIDGEITGAVEVFSNNAAMQAAHSRISKLEETILLDPLTRIGNRRYVDNKLRNAFQEFEQARYTFGILFMDIDHFKQVNDQYGHATGDKVLQVISRTLSHNLRSTDVLARWGGEEFIVLIYDINVDQLQRTADKLRTLVEQSSIRDNLHGDIKVTISVGGTIARNGDSMGAIVNRADALMYKSKNEGRNRINVG